MTRPALVLRPEAGNTRTCERLRAAGLTPIAWPLFATTALPWRAPDPVAFDAMLLTSANAVRLAGAELAGVAHLPVVAVGAATAAAARAAGLRVVHSGAGDAAAAAAALPGARLLHLAGRDHVAVAGAAVATVYASDPVAIDARALRRVAAGSVALLHSARAAVRLRELTDAASRKRIRLAALSPAVLAAAGEGWEGAEAAAVPDDAVLVALARALAIDRPDRDGDNAG